jgi:MbtH protein
MDQENDDNRTYRVVINHEEQYSIWAADRPLPLGWRDAGKAGSKQECLSYIGEVWTDMRPLSLRKAMENESESPESRPS